MFARQSLLVAARVDVILIFNRDIHRVTKRASHRAASNSNSPYVYTPTTFQPVWKSMSKIPITFDRSSCICWCVMRNMMCDAFSISNWSIKSQLKLRNILIFGYRDETVFWFGNNWNRVCDVSLSHH